LLSGKTMICSFDLAKKRHAFHVLDHERRAVARGTVPHSLEGLEALLNRLASLKAEHGCERIVFLMEGASHFWMPIASLLQRRGYPYRLVTNRSVGHQRHLAGQSGQKSDPDDAIHIADLGGALHFTFTQLPLAEPWIRLRTCACEYQDLADLATAEKNRVHAFLETVFPAYYEVFVDPFRPSSMALLRSLSGAQELDKTGFIAYVRQHFRGRKLQVKRCLSAWQLVRSGTPWGYVEARAALFERIAAATQRLDLFLKQQADVEKRLLGLYRSIPLARYLDSIPGSSPLTNAITLGVLGDPRAFDDARALVSLAGLNPGERSSGEWQGKAHITKAGRARLRRASTTAAMTILKSGRNHDFTRRFFYLQRREERPLNALQALCACAGKYLRTLWWLCTTEATYNGEIASRGLPHKRQTPSAPSPEPLVVEIAEAMHANAKD